MSAVYNESSEKGWSVNTTKCQQFLMRVLNERVCGYRHMSAVSNESSEREGLWIKTCVSSL
jgi:hypothetical protein